VPLWDYNEVVILASILKRSVFNIAFWALPLLQSLLAGLINLKGW